VQLLSPLFQLRRVFQAIFATPFVDSEASQKLSTYHAVRNAVGLASADVVQKPANLDKGYISIASDSATSTAYLETASTCRMSPSLQPLSLRSSSALSDEGRLLESTSQLFQFSSYGVDQNRAILIIKSRMANGADKNHSRLLSQIKIDRSRFRKCNKRSVLQSLNAYQVS